MLPTIVPPDSGLIQIELSVPPVSFQAAGSKKATIKQAIGAMVSPCAYLLPGDVQVEIEWRISERARYEGDNSADVDNIIKPILDALCGPAGIMIDDCQVQALTCYWTGGYSYPQEESVRIEIKFDPDAFLSKNDVIFLHIERGLYLPIHDSLPGEFVLKLAEGIIGRFQTFREHVSLGVPESSARLILPIQRVFHKSKLGAFRTTTIDELRQRFT